MSKRWTEKEHAFLIYWGPAAGYDYVAWHDLGKARSVGARRAKWLRKYHPEFVAKIEAQCAADDLATEANFT